MKWIEIKNQLVNLDNVFTVRCEPRPQSESFRVIIVSVNPNSDAYVDVDDYDTARDIVEAIRSVIGAVTKINYE